MRRVLGTLLLALVAGACGRSGSPGSMDVSPRSPDPKLRVQQAVSNPAVPELASSSMATATLTIEGMVCEGCARVAQRALEEVDGVHFVGIDFQRGTAAVEFNPQRTDVEQLARAIEGVRRDPAPAFRVARSEVSVDSQLQRVR